MEYSNELASVVNRIVVDLSRGKILVRLMSGQFCFIVGHKFRLVEHTAINKLMEEKLLQETFKYMGMKYYKLI